MKYRRSIHDAAVLALLAALVLVIVVGLVRGPKFRLQAIDVETVPAEVRDWSPGFGATNVVWRDFHQEPASWSTKATLEGVSALASSTVAEDGALTAAVMRHCPLSMTFTRTASPFIPKRQES